MHVKHGQEKPTGMHYLEGTDSLDGFRCDTWAEPLSLVRGCPTRVVLSGMRKC